ncbi:hypothetical protein [Nocardia asiatica]|nr:hypothetical protein [Nocardia asiatica]
MTAPASRERSFWWAFAALALVITIAALWFLLMIAIGGTITA